MAWPTTGVGSLASGYLAQGITTLRWGTDEVVQQINSVAVASFLVVLRASERALVTNNKLPQGDGVTKGRVQIVDGVAWDLVVRDDTGATGLPKIGTSVTVVDMAGLIDAVGEVYTATVVESGYDANVGQAGERTITVENLLLVESQTGSTQA